MARAAATVVRSDSLSLAPLDGNALRPTTPRGRVARVVWQKRRLVSSRSATVAGTDPRQKVETSTRYNCPSACAHRVVLQRQLALRICWISWLRDAMRHALLGDPFAPEPHCATAPTRGNSEMTPAGLEPAIPGSVGRCLIHWATGPDDQASICCNKNKEART